MNNKVYLLHEATLGDREKCLFCQLYENKHKRVKQNEETEKSNDLREKILERRMHEHNNFNKKMKNIRKYQIEVIELKNTRAELINTLQGFNYRLDETLGRISQLEDRNLPSQSSKKKKG